MAYLKYRSELGQEKPKSDGEAMLSHYGKHYFIKTDLKLKGRGIELTDTGDYRGQYRYRVTVKAFEKLCEKFNFVSDMLFD